jgi:hypothetical protein
MVSVRKKRPMTQAEIKRSVAFWNKKFNAAAEASRRAEIAGRKAIANLERVQAACPHRWGKEDHSVADLAEMKERTFCSACGAQL